MKQSAPELSALIIIFRSTGPGDLDARRSRSAARGAPASRPRARGRRPGRRRALAGGEPRLPHGARREQLARRSPNRPLQIGDERQRLGREDARRLGRRPGGGVEQLDSGGRVLGHGGGA
jgi:hypothetical protein